MQVTCLILNHNRFPRFLLLMLPERDIASVNNNEISRYCEICKVVIDLHLEQLNEKAKETREISQVVRLSLTNHQELRNPG